MIDTLQRQQIDAYLLSCRSRLFGWGSWDCCLFCADVLAILTGNDFGAPWRGGYSDRASALSILPCQIRELPEWVGLRPSRAQDGAVWWSPGKYAEGALGIWWQGRALHPGRRGLIGPMFDISKLQFFS